MVATAATWYLRAHDDGRPLGIHIHDEEPLEPTPGIVINAEDPNQTWRSAEVVSFEALPNACSMPRYNVIVKVLVPA